jgi:pimeloyl-ACP methyl ester carboxylesterase
MDTGTRYLDRPDGRLAYSVAGSGPLVVLSPGMGDLRDVFRDVVGPLVAAGYRVASTDLRGHGDSSTTFAEHGARATAGDLVALVTHLGGPAVLVGHSISAGAAAIVAAEHPELVSALALLDPHLQVSRAGLVARLQTQAIRRPFGARLWASYYRSLHKGRTADWYPEHVVAVHTALRDAGRIRSFGALARALVASPVAIPLDRITAPTLVLHAEHDPEFADPAGELAYALDHLTGTHPVGVMVPDAGHYPHSQRPDVVVPALLELLSAADVPRA